MSEATTGNTRPTHVAALMRATNVGSAARKSRATAAARSGGDAAHRAFEARLHGMTPIDAERAAPAVALSHGRQKEHAADNHKGQRDREQALLQLVRIGAGRLRL